MRQGFKIKLPEARKRSICIGERLEISQIMYGIAVPYLMKLNAFVNLVMQALSRRTVSRMKSGIVTICASSPADGPVPVGTRKAGIQNDFLQPFPVNSPEMPHESIVSLSFRERRHTAG